MARPSHAENLPQTVGGAGGTKHEDPKDVESAPDGRGRIPLLQRVEGDLVKGVWYVCAKEEQVLARRSGTVKIESVIHKVLNAR